MGMREFRGAVLKSLFLDEQVDAFYRSFQQFHPEFTKNNRWSAVKYIMRLNFAQYKRRSLSTVRKPNNAGAYYIEQIDSKFNKSIPANTVNNKIKSDKLKKNIYYYLNDGECREGNDFLLNELMQYDVISFDVFDTALYRKVEFPNDVFTIMAAEIGHNDFQNVRKKAEVVARAKRDQIYGDREIVLSDIYNVLEERYGVDKKWQDREIQLEIELSMPNLYIRDVYEKLIAAQKTVVFTSDMYLPKAVIEEMLKINGYKGYNCLYLSNEYKLRKGDGQLQKVLLQDYPREKIVHIGDTPGGDVQQSKAAGIDAIYNSNSHLIYREADMDSLAGSFYRAIIQTTLNNGMWKSNKKSIQFEHGFRVGGILTVGYCEYINRVAKEKKIDKILFCARDCDIIYKIYNKHYAEYPNEYIKISRYAIMAVTGGRYLYDWLDRYILRYVDNAGDSKTIAEILEEAGFGYLIDYLEEADLDRFLYAKNIKKNKLEEFLYNHADVIAEHNKSHVEAAKKYFDAVIGDARDILIVDIGWSGTCISALQYFLNTYFEDRVDMVVGALMCTSRNKPLTISISNGDISAYVYSPFSNMDLTRHMMPAQTSVRDQDLLHMPLEFMFTSTDKSLVGYVENSAGTIGFDYTGYEPKNKVEILQMQEGMKSFAQMYEYFRKGFEKISPISAYVAFNPLREAVRRRDYCKAVYQNFTYDAFSVPFMDAKTVARFIDLFDDKTLISFTEPEITGIEKNSDRGERKILFVSPELPFTGAPRSLLRMCKVAKQLGYSPVVWSSKMGPMINEYEANGIPVKIVPENRLRSNEIKDEIMTFAMAICNTIVTDKYVKACEGRIPLIWYIREATNIMDFCRDNPERLELLRNSKDLCCVSRYAAEALGEYNKNPIRIIHNCVEDEVDMALPYTTGEGEKIKFVQFGTMEYRKGYDVLIAAYEAMPEEYRVQSELYFAGGFINSGTPYCSYIFSKIDKNPNIHYLGVVKGEKNKIETLSQMDVVVVASRDESCSLVALEGAMLSKPIIVTESVGAKYMVKDGNGLIAKTGDVETLKEAMIYIIDHRQNLKEMGKISRINYESMAGMDSYTNDLEILYSFCNNKMAINTGMFYTAETDGKLSVSGKKTEADSADVIISLTSHPGRIKTVDACIREFFNQTVRPKKILLWLSEEQFPNREKDLPQNLLKLRNRLFAIRWTKDDLKPHKKYFYTMEEYPDAAVIIVDDDVIYDKHLVENLRESYHKFPQSISAMRTNLMMFKPDGRFREYDNWQYGYKMLRDVPSYQLLPTGVGGVLYPPHIFDRNVFDKGAIFETSLFCDDLWLKFNAVRLGVKTVLCQNIAGYHDIPQTQKVALWRMNVNGNNNDVCIEKILSYFDKKYGNASEIVSVMRKDRFC